MSKNGNGNVQREEPARKKPKEIFKPGDIVRLTPDAMKNGPSLMAPKRLYSVGWPNEFQVIDVFEMEDGPYITLNACCRNLIRHATGAWVCTGHPAKWFEKTKPEAAARPRKKGDRSTSITVPFMGELGAIDYLEDEEDPGLVLRILGQQTVMKGSVAKAVAQFAKDNGLL